MTPRYRLREAREVRELTQGDLARMADLHTPTSALFEDDSFRPSPSGTTKLATALGITPEELTDSR
jgi:transcriptional regulator with XRE-family HTH domain